MLFAEVAVAGDDVFVLRVALLIAISMTIAAASSAQTIDVIGTIEPDETVVVALPGGDGGRP